MILETKRLYLRQFTEADLRDLSKILQDKDVMYAYEHAFDDSEVRQWLIKQLYRYQKDGFGLWAVIRKSDNTLIGQCGITMQNCNGIRVKEVGYLFAKAYWHHGYATEAAKACCQYAFKHLHTDEVYAIIRESNQASIHVALRLGMHPTLTFIKHYHGIDMPHIAFVLKKEKK